ncbi:ras GTPase-activating protein 1-like [Sycon ciliatum]|uniref:ras GTPase-activating protein 1-like n=1 Tax=Sycon ciliatum TaxID=27933 RepID=UPI0031F607B3
MASHGEDEFFTDGNKIYYDLETLERSLAKNAEEHYEEDEEFELDEEDGAAEYNAPPEREWYHGRLDRKTAEERLRRYGHPGSYLVRESDRQPGTYSLSFLGVTGISHFRITTFAGQYYIGGRQFYSLKELIGYYASRSRLLENEVLQYPLAPQEEVARRRRVIALYSCQTQQSESLDGEIPFNMGDVFTVDDVFNDEYIWCTSVNDASKGGLVPLALVQDALSVLCVCKISAPVTWL